MSKQNRNPGSQRQQPQQGTGAGSRQMEQQTGGARQQGEIDFETDWDGEEYQPEQQEGETPQGDDPDFRTKPGGMQHEQQGGAGAQPGSTGLGDAEARRGSGRPARKNRDRDRGDPENR